MIFFYAQFLLFRKEFIYIKIGKCEIWKDELCNECRSQNDVKELYEILNMDYLVHKAEEIFK